MEVYVKNCNSEKGQTGPIVVGIVLVVMAIAGLVVALNSFHSTPGDKMGVVYGGGPIDKKEYVQTLPPGSGLANIGVFNKVYEYPTTQRTFVVDPAGGDSAVSISTVTKDKISVDWVATTYFKLNTDKVGKFHQNIGFKYVAWEEGGWNRMLAETLKPQIAEALQTASRKYTVAELYSNQEAIISIQEEVAASLKGNVNDVLGDDYFCGPGEVKNGCADFRFVIPSKPIIPASIVEAFESNQTSEIAVQTATNKVEVNKQEALGIKILADATRAAGEAYLELKRIEAQQTAAANGGVFYLPYGSDVMVNPGK
jgi:regulator of protease activity HflC (stomatin/prohibitin superfamily)